MNATEIMSRLADDLEVMVLEGHVTRNDIEDALMAVRKATIQEVIKELKTGYVEDLEAGEYWNSGNFDDCFNEGCVYGHNDAQGKFINIFTEMLEETP